VAGLLALGTAGCGFRPIYSGGAAAGSDAALAADMAATRVAVIPDRFGQLLRRALQQRLGQGRGESVAARWELLVGPSVSGEAVGIQSDGAATRVRMIATANWTLLRLTPRETVANGFERTLDAYNIQGVQLFAADASREAMERRLGAAGRRGRAAPGDAVPAAARRRHGPADRTGGGAGADAPIPAAACRRDAAEPRRRRERRARQRHRRAGWLPMSAPRLRPIG